MEEKRERKREATQLTCVFLGLLKTATHPALY